ncbi:MAG: hypothetical protein QOE99_3336 [Actinomycetota bacterium]|jgi:hypothetical protein|nr:hypothetical protein [Actinomycetota bacterium]
MPRRPAVLLLSFWLGGVVLATGTGLLGVRLVAARVGDPAGPVLSAGDVQRGLATPLPSPRAAQASPRQLAPSPRVSAPSPAASLTIGNPDPQAQSAPPPAVRAFSSAGGSVGVRCRGTTPERVYATPAQGYQLDDASLHGAMLEVRFDNDRNEVRMQISCSTSKPEVVQLRNDSKGGSD